MKHSFAVVSTACLAALAGVDAAAQSAPAAVAPAVHAKVYVNVPVVQTATVSSGESGGWRAQLEKSGILSQSGPYRLGVPLADFGPGNAKLSFTYIPRMKDGVGSRVLMFMLRTSID